MSMRLGAPAGTSCAGWIFTCAPLFFCMDMMVSPPCPMIFPAHDAGHITSSRADPGRG